LLDRDRYDHCRRYAKRGCWDCVAVDISVLHSHLIGTGCRPDIVTAEQEFFEKVGYNQYIGVLEEWDEGRLRLLIRKQCG
jgi:hypothetical protein